MTTDTHSLRSSINQNNHSRLRLLIALIFLCASTYIGYDLSLSHATPFIPGTPLDKDFWLYKKSGINPLSQSDSLPSNVMILAGSLQLNPYGILEPRKVLPFEDLEIRLSSLSDPIHILLSNGSKKTAIDITPTTFQLQNNGDWLFCNCTRTFRFYTKKQSTWLQVGSKHKKLASFPLKSFQLASKMGTGHIEHIQILDAQYGIIYKNNFSEQKIPSHIPYWGASIGLFLGIPLLFLIINHTSIIPFFILTICTYLPTSWVLTHIPSYWSELVQKLYLTHTSPWALAQYMLLFSLIPASIVTLSLLRLGITNRITPIQNQRRAWLIWLSIIFSIIVLEILRSGWSVYVPLQFVFLLLPCWPFLKRGLNLTFLIREIPTILMICILGWGWGFLFAILWRSIIIFSSIPILLEYKLSRTVDLLFLYAILFPIGMESTIRSTYLNKAWYVDTLSSKYNQEDPSKFLIPIWNESCGNTQPKQKKRIVFIGGSSTGGVYQFRKEPSLFFAGRTHTQLCKRIPDDMSIQTQNFGRAAMDTHIIAHSFDSLLHTTKADLVVMYVGNNDLLTRKSPLSKKQLYDRMQHWASQVSGLKEYTAKSRLIIGSSLFFRQLDHFTKFVVSVPTQDAKENFEMIAKIAQKHNTEILLLTEFINPSSIQPFGTNTDEIDIKTVFSEYRTIQKTISENHPHVHYIDTWDLLPKFLNEDLFIDSNHLNQQGNQRIADIISPTIEQLLQKKPL